MALSQKLLVMGEADVTKVFFLSHKIAPFGQTLKIERGAHGKD